MLVIVGLFALVFAFWEMLWPVYLLAAGPFCGSVINRGKGGDCAMGGVTGGFLSYSGFVMFVCVGMYHDGSSAVDCSVVFLSLFTVASISGALVGLAAGCLVEAAADPILRFSTIQKNPTEPVTNVSLFDSELPRMTREE